MIPRTLSASSLQVWALCPDRWMAEYLHRGANFSNVAADTGTSVHGGLEKYVEAVHIDKTHQPSFDLLVSFYQMSYVQTFNTTDMDTDQYRDGYELIKKWFTRTKFDHVLQVLTVEVKRTIEIPFNHPEGTVHACEKCQDNPKYAGTGRCFIPFNYIMDRVDQIGVAEYEVVDYKTIRVPLDPAALENKLQARAYALAMQIEHPEATRIKVTFDLLRHEKISLWFTREDNINFWNFLTSEAQRIVDTPEEDVKPNLNPECGYCVKKFDCPVMQSNVAVGGIHSISMDRAVKIKADLENQIKANKAILDALEDQLFRYAVENDTLEWVTEDGAYEVEVKSSRRRGFDARAAARIMGPDLFAQMGGMTLGNLEKIIKDSSLDEIMRKELADLIGWENGNPSLKVKKKSKVF